ncbi:ShlB/FhaC/HecB family hemolysin secretion/activation protein [Trinickia dinghuensis]|uniref:ShlB/FhaC/HecB family hemolysin secretion/activation protein n=1 Tax=Trinickia dinghuensis TaxID=2291023 RepID=A0A3D8JX04_9BURK|nr:ShlB/FhaC/HecB family hemolysin secretion/activation protein [Trinickia dinghuensis]RDU97332.1 ShlB/FhaC/HecB family hemolysin secretion/activation protein [Trinickia dinghuensis]
MKRTLRGKLKWTGAALAVISATAAAQSYRDVAPTPPPAPSRPTSPPPPPEPSSGSQQVAVADLRGIVFVKDDGKVVVRSQGLPKGKQVAAVNLPPLDDAFLAGFDKDIGHRLTFARLAEIRRSVIERFRTEGEPLVDVYVPEQDVSDGVVHIAVTEFHLGKVTARGNRYFSEAQLVREMPLKSGGAIRESDVSTGLALLNANPYRSVDVVYSPGQSTNSTDVVLQTQDRLPLRVNAGYDNAGVQSLGRDRFFAGIDYGNLFGLDQEISYQYTASNDLFSGNPPNEGRPDRPRFQAHSFSYSAPLPWFDRVEFFGLYAQSTPRTGDSIFNQTGISSQFSFRYDRHLPFVDGWKQQVQFGYDFKRSNNDLEFGGEQVFTANTHVHQFLVTYDASKSDALGQTHANVALFGSPGHFDGDNTDSEFQLTRSGATARYTYLQLLAERSLTIGAGFMLSTRGQFQWTPNTLLPSEEMGLGGDDTLRGYEPYSVQGDRGWNLQTEVRTPAFAFFGDNGPAFQPFAFVDAGHVWNKIDQPAEVQAGMLSSVGVGVRFQWSRFVNARLTYGQPLRAVVPGGSKAPMAQVLVVIGS